MTARRPPGDANGVHPEVKKAEEEAQTLNQNRESILLGARTGEARTGSAELEPGAMRDLQRLVVVLRDEPDRQVVIIPPTNPTAGAGKQPPEQHPEQAYPQD